MAFLFADGFDHWSTPANAASVYHNIGNGFFVDNNAANARTGTGSVYTAESTNHYGYYLNIAPASNVLITQIAMSTPSLPTSDNNGFSFGTANRAATFLSVYYNTSGGLSVYLGTTGTLLGKTADGILGVNSYVSVQCRVVIDPVNGSVELRINGAADPVLLLEGINTTNGAGTTIGSFSFGIIYDRGTPVFHFDDLVIFDDSGTTDNDFVGDMRCRTRYTNANGPNQDFTSLSGAAAYSELSHVPSVPATYGIVGAAAGNESNFGLDLVPDNTSFCAGMFVFAQVLKSDAGASHLNINFQSGVSSSPNIGVNPGTAAAYYTGACEVDPATGTYWTKAALQAAMVNFVRDV